MKKIYMTPSAKVVILNASPVLAGSFGEGEQPKNDDIIDGGAALSKRGYRFDLVDEDFE